MGTVWSVVVGEADARDILISVLTVLYSSGLPSDQPQVGMNLPRTASTSVDAGPSERAGTRLLEQAELIRSFHTHQLICHQLSCDVAACNLI